MADVLYIIGDGSRYGNAELKYSLRSLSKYGRNYGRVFITGKCPDFVNRDRVIFTPEIDIGRPMINHWWKVFQTFWKTEISEKIVLMYDDVFLTRPVDLSHYPWYYRGELPHDKPHGEYGKCLYAARLQLEKNEIRTQHNFECHCPCIYQRKMFLTFSPLYDALKLCDSPPAVRSMYANTWLCVDNRIKFRDDLKIRAFVKDLPALIADRDCFSIADDCFEGSVEDYLKSEFPEKCEFER